jgi:crotonobetainyl-CoA:carnitine CoA-transferase CaiB-like acyl-CoA transferase
MTRQRDLQDRGIQFPALVPPGQQRPSPFARRLRGDREPIAIDVSMIGSALLLMSGPASLTLATGKPPPKVGNRGFVGSPGAETFATSDGHIYVAANTKGQFEVLCGCWAAVSWRSLPLCLAVSPARPF